MQKWMEKPVSELKQAISDFVTEKISENDLKKVTAGFGIYPQKNKLFMIRIRITGGEITTEKLSAIYTIIENYNIPFARLTTRQDIQLHSVNARDINEIIDILISKDFIFRGGGGDTFRNITVSYDSGLSKNTVFDVMPYAEAVTDVLYKMDSAYSLPRKIKIAFSSDNSDKAFARWSDLGFIATLNEEGEKGFEVYMAGGMGRNSRKAIKAENFIPADMCMEYAVAMVNLFDENGNRENRSKARIRFLRERLGDSEFLNLYKKYFDNLNRSFDDISIVKKEYTCKNIPDVNEADICRDSFQNWLDNFCEPSLFQEYSIVRVPVVSGNLNINNFSLLLKAFDKVAVKWVRINRVHELVALVDNSLLEALYKELNEDSNENFTNRCFCGHLTSCVGNTICPMGLIDSQKFAYEIGKALDGLDLTDFEYDQIINNISISGCGNSCANPDVFAVSVIGKKMKTEEGMCEGCTIKVAKGYVGNDEEIIVESKFSDLASEIRKLF